MTIVCGIRVQACDGATSGGLPELPAESAKDMSWMSVSQQDPVKRISKHGQYVHNMLPGIPCGRSRALLNQGMSSPAKRHAIAIPAPWLAECKLTPRRERLRSETQELESN